MTLTQLNYFITIAETKSINKAAEQLYVSQPSLTSAVQELEKELGITLLNRSGRGVTLTNDGAEFLLYAKQLYGQYEMILEKYGENGSLKKKFGVSTQHYSFAVKAFVDMTDRIISDICREFNVDEHWLRTGEGGEDVIFVENDSAIIAELANEYKLDAVDIKIIEHYIKLPDEDRKKIKNYIVDLAAQINSIDKPSLLDVTATTDIEVEEKAEDRAEREGEAIKQKYIKEKLLEQKTKTS